MAHQATDLALVLTTEHILLESDVREIPALRAARKVHAQIELRSRLRRRVLELRLIDYYYLAVQSRSRSAKLEYVLDLRFVDSPPLLSRHTAWRWITASLVLLALVVAMAGHMGSAATPWWKHDWLRWCAAVTALWAVVTFIAAYRTTETVRLLSTHGRAMTLDFTGGVGTFRVARRFLAQLAAHLRLASAARRPTKAEHLRDEMREHQRLRDIGVLNPDEYEASKVRILAAHSVPARKR
jgi:hypothetical protein